MDVVRDKNNTYIHIIKIQKNNIKISLIIGKRFEESRLLKLKECVEIIIFIHAKMRKIQMAINRSILGLTRPDFSLGTQNFVPVRLQLFPLSKKAVAEQQWRFKTGFTNKARDMLSFLSIIYCISRINHIVI